MADRSAIWPALVAAHRLKRCKLLNELLWVACEYIDHICLRLQVKCLLILDLVERCIVCCHDWMRLLLVLKIMILIVWSWFLRRQLFFLWLLVCLLTGPEECDVGIWKSWKIELLGNLIRAIALSTRKRIIVTNYLYRVCWLQHLENQVFVRAGICGYEWNFRRLVILFILGLL